MDQLFLGIALKDWAWLIGGLLTFITFVKGLIEYSRNNKIKRAEFLEKLIEQFNEPNTYLARRVLDDFWIGKEVSPEMSDKQLIQKGNEESEQGRKDFSIKELLRDHKLKSVPNPVEQRARQSFDDLLDFFTKLDYYLTLKLISKSELYYFGYYIKQRAYKKGAVLEYAKTYGYPALRRLLYVLKVETKYTVQYELQWESERQEGLFYDLRNDLSVW